MHITQQLIFAALLALAASAMNAAHASVTVFDNRADWQGAAGPSETIDFATDDAGNPISSPPAQVPFSAITIKGVTFTNGISSGNAVFQTMPGTAMRAKLPDNTTAFALDWGLVAEFPGTVTFQLSTGETFHPIPVFIPYALGTAFFGVTSTTPIAWVDFSMNSTGVVIDNFSFVAPAMQVSIDIKPGSGTNPVNLSSEGVIPVALLSSASFPAATADWQSLRFGRTGTEAALAGYSNSDVDGDGLMDLMLHFRTADAGLACGDSAGILTGQTVTGKKFRGTDSIRTICKGP